jgi:hypothetical protein
MKRHRKSDPAEVNFGIRRPGVGVPAGPVRQSIGRVGSTVMVGSVTVTARQILMMAEPRAAFAGAVNA